MKRTTIVLADNHQVVREGLRSLLQTVPDFAVLGDEGDGLKVFDVVERLRPDVLILDLMMPGLHGLEITRKVARDLPKTRVVILSMYANEAYVLNALRYGAIGYVLKDAASGELLRAVQEAAAGRRYLSPPLSDKAIEAYAREVAISTLDPYETLTGREREVLQLAAEGLTNAQIGARLNISPRTTETHRANLMRKLGLHAFADLVKYALTRGILPRDG